MNQIKVSLSTPKEINSSIRTFVSSFIHGEPEFHFIDYFFVPEIRPQLANCHINSAVYSKIFGGKICFGWIIWVSADFRFLDAEFHSVVKHEGKLKDVTPKTDGESVILFVEDPSRAPTFELSGNQHYINTFDNFRFDGRFSGGLPVKRLFAEIRE